MITDEQKAFYWGTLPEWVRLLWVEVENGLPMPDEQPGEGWPSHREVWRDGFATAAPVIGSKSSKAWPLIARRIVERISALYRTNNVPALAIACLSPKGQGNYEAFYSARLATNAMLKSVVLLLEATPDKTPSVAEAVKQAVVAIQMANSDRWFESRVDEYIAISEDIIAVALELKGAGK